MNCWIEGELDPYYEQGWEGSFRYNLTVPGMNEPYFLKDDDLLDILDQDGQPLWSGFFRLRKRRFWERHKLGSDVFSDTVLKGLSYQQWMEWLWSNPRLKARILRPDESGQIVYAWSGRHDLRPLRLRDAGIERCRGREILEWSANLGTYGMGGPGFVGFRLKSTDNFPEEWFTLTLWGAGDWLLINDRWLSAHPKYYEIQEPLYSNFGEEQTWDKVTPLVKGAVVESMQIEPTHFMLTLSKEGQKAWIQLPQDTERLPRFGGTDQPRIWNDSEEVQDAWAFYEDTLCC
jgi:hypothetical protein